MSLEPPPSESSGCRVVLHVGCGRAQVHEAFRTPDWREVRLDINPNVAPDVVASMTDMSVVPTATVDAIWSSHNLEHLFAHEVGVALGEFHRVLKPGGIVSIRVPDLRYAAEQIVADRLDDPLYVSPSGPVSALDMIYGHRVSIRSGDVFMAHRTGFTVKTLLAHLNQAGFGYAGIWQGNLELWALATNSRRLSPHPAQFAKMMRERMNVEIDGAD